MGVLRATFADISRIRFRGMSCSKVGVSVLIPQIHFSYIVSSLSDIKFFSPNHSDPKYVFWNQNVDCLIPLSYIAHEYEVVCILI